jgi:dTDP-4-amino-4,6-dideoxygalactose transaminase
MSTVVALDIGPSDEVICPSLSFIATAFLLAGPLLEP